MRWIPLCLWIAMPCQAMALVPIPNLSGPVIDSAGVLSDSEERDLESRLQGVRETAQIQVWTLASTEGEAIEALGIRAADLWKLGDAKKDNGLILIVAVKDRRVRIEVGQGLEGLIPDITAGRIIDEQIVPSFRSGNYFQGISQGVDAITRAVHGEAYVPQDPASSTSGLWVFLHLLFFLTVPVFVIVMNLRYRRGFGSGYGSWGGGGFGGGGFGGGGGWSGGGGGFSGGGASRGW